MTNNNLNIHDGALEYLVKHLDLINLNRKDISWVLKEPIIYCPQEIQMSRACDIVVGYNEHRYADLIELKHSYQQKDKAIGQMKNTNRMFLENIGYRLHNMYIVLYPFFDYKIVLNYKNNHN
jgi:hypothetical protein